MQDVMLWQRPQLRCLSTSRSRRLNYRHGPPLPPEPTVTSEDGSRTLRTRQHGEKSLPLSTLMDPLAIAARERYKKPKPRAQTQESGALTAFQEALYANPHAHALAAPVRQCHLTRARLPTSFLIPFTAELPPRDSSAGDVKPKLVPVIGFRSRCTKSYLVGTRRAVAEVDGRKKGKWQFLVSERLKKQHARRIGKSVNHVNVGKEWTYDAGILGDVLREKMSAVVLAALTACLEFEEGRLVAPWSVAQANVACVLRVSRATENGENAADATEDKSVETHDLRGILEENCFSQLAALLEARWPETRAFALLEHEKTVPTLIAFQKLSNYLRN